jgi:outer membrane protein insertion porin family
MSGWVRVLGGRRAALVAIVLAALAAAAAGILAASAPAAAQASAILVEGNRRVDADTIRGYFHPRPGGQLDAAKIDEGIKGLYATGMFEDVRIRRAPGGRLVVTVVENRIINRVAFEGNKKVKDEALVAEVQSKSRLPLSRPVVQADVQRIIEVYRRGGRYDVRVEPKIVDRPNGRVDLIFEITEGGRTTIKRIVFVGNKAFSDWRLRDTISSGTTNLLSFLKGNDVYDPDRVNADQEQLRRFYLKNGYADFRILSANVVSDARAGGFVLTITLDEGEQYRFGTVEVLSNLRTVDGATLRRLTRGSTGAVYNAELVEKSMEEITIELSRRGYAFAQVRPRGDRDFAAKRINVLYVVEEGPRVYVERINIRGNTRTRDYVIRREFDLYEGDAYNRVLIDRAERRLKNLGFFKTVKITNETGSAADRVIVNVDLEEQMTGEFSVAGGYSTADGLIGEVSIGERNFLGRGQYVRLGGTLGQRSRGAEFSFTEPYFLDYGIAAGFDVFSKLTEASSYYSYNMRLTGGTLRAGIALRDDLTLAPRYTLYNRNITLPLGAAAFASVAVQQAVGSAVTSLVGYVLTFNQLDSNLNPREGPHVAFSQDFAGLGGDAKYIRTSLDARYYYPLPFQSDYVLMLRGQAGNVWGWGGTPLTIFDHFFRGPEIVRGFATAGIGPRDTNPLSTQDALGGTLYWGTTAEVSFPIFFAPKDFGLRAAVFADAGSLWGYTGATFFPTIPSPYAAPYTCPGFPAVLPGAPSRVCLSDGNVVRSSVGVSLIWASPFGPLRFDYAYPITKAPWDKVQSFRFGGGTRF